MPTMRGRHRLVFAVATLIAVLALGVLSRAGAMFVLDAPPPLLLADVEDTLPALPPSIVAEPVTFDLQTVMDSLEAAVPATYGDLDQRIPTPTNRRVSFAFLVHRSPFRLKVVGQTVFLSADIEYSGRIWYKPTLGPAVEVSCGTGNDLPRRATLTLECTGDLTADWGVRTHSRVVRLAAYSDSSRDHCRLSFLRIDVTQRVLEKTYRMINEKLGDFDGVVARWPVRRRFEKVWRDLQKPMRLADSLYMTIGPSEAQVGSIGANGKVAFANLRLKAAPRIVTGPRPRFAPVPLPPLTRERDPGHGARVLLEASFQYPIATLILRKALVGRSVDEMGRKVHIRDVRLSGSAPARWRSVSGSRARCAASSFSRARRASTWRATRSSSARRRRASAASSPTPSSRKIDRARRTGVTIAARVRDDVFVPEDQQGDVLAPQFAMRAGPIWLLDAPVAPFAAPTGVERRLKRAVAHVPARARIAPRLPSASASPAPSSAPCRAGGRSRGLTRMKTSAE